jgi:ribosomal protein L35
MNKSNKTLLKRFKISHPKRGKFKIEHNTQGVNHLTGKRSSERQERNNTDKKLSVSSARKIRKIISGHKI